MVNQLQACRKANAAMMLLALEYFCDIRALKNLQRNNNDAGFSRAAGVLAQLSMR